ncbi:MAG: hypothetical protein PHH77_10300 [Victivallaceae bacterium]|nr:hypothetical protein [Victivallaceae bacterium]
MIAIKIVKAGSLPALQPLTCCRELYQISVAGLTVAEQLEKLFAGVPDSIQGSLEIRSDFVPSAAVIARVAAGSENLLLIRSDGSAALKFTASDSGIYTELEPDAESMDLSYPWDILAWNEKLVGAISENRIAGTVSEAAHIDGVLQVGEGTVLLPGVYVEGKVIIGRNCKIGPNCYLRGNTCIGDDCHIGQGVEIKNSLLMDKVSVGHLSYFGDSIICSQTNIGAGTIAANLRHDGQNHRSLVNGELLDTGRRKLGAIIGDHVHTGIHCSIYPGRKLWPYVCTVPGAIVKKDLVCP